MIVLTGSYVISEEQNQQQRLNLFHNFQCPVTFEVFYTKAKLKVVPDLDVQLLEFEILDEDKVSLAMQIMMPIHSGHENLIRVFQAIGFEIFDSLHLDASVYMNVIIPPLNWSIQDSMKEVLGSLGLSELFEKSNEHAFKMDFYLRDFLQFIYLSMSPNVGKIFNGEAAAVIVNRPFIFRIIDAKTLKPKLMGSILCPMSEKISYDKNLCMAMKGNCNVHGFCSRLDEICSLWNQCSNV